MLCLVKAFLPYCSPSLLCNLIHKAIAITNVSILAVFLQYLRQFLINLHQIYRHSSVPKKHVSVHFLSFLAATFFGHVVPVTV